MNNLLFYKDFIFEIKCKIQKKDKSLFDHTIINNNKIDENTISIVMTSSNRSKQTYFTLSTIQKSQYKNIQVIIVDDSDTDIINEDILQQYPFYIDFIKINKSNKKWHNPLINYNLGFTFIKGSKVLIQNAEVCHIGDVLLYISNNLQDNNYYVFDVNASLDYKTNEIIYNENVNNTDIYNKTELFSMWYQNNSNLRNYHFLTAMTKTTFDKIKEFSYDCTMGSSYDDNDFLLKIMSKNIEICNIFHETYKLGGIHLFHGRAPEIWDKNIEENEILFCNKEKFYNNNNNYIDITEDKITFFEKYKLLYCVSNSIDEYNNKIKDYKKQICKTKTIVSITGIRPDFIRMSTIFKKLDENFNHILIHTGQHYDELLSDVFFKELSIRPPDFILDSGKNSKNHFEQLSYLCTAVPQLFKDNNIDPDLIVFLGDSNTVGISFSLKKQGYKIAHIEAGMRSGDKRMLEEINRTVCDHCSDLLFVYHEDYRKNLEIENIKNNVHVISNTIIEPFKNINKDFINEAKKNNCILIDIHRPENFNYIERINSIFQFANICSQKYNLPVKLLYFKRLQDIINNNNLDLGNIEIIPLMSFSKYLYTVYHSLFIISDSGTAQEEPALLNTPVVVPRDFSERPQSFENNCSKKLQLDIRNDTEVFDWINKISSGDIKMDVGWLGNGNASELVIENIMDFFVK